jgi:hypothetical protein
MLGGGVVLSQPVSTAQSRTYCLSKDGWARPGFQASAGQNREESGVSTSSARIRSPRASVPSSILVSAMMMPRRAAISLPRR